jgi:uncharacterized protein YcbK (DUF882 family)
MDPHLLAVLQTVRDDVGFSLHINSGFRCETHNTTVGGKKSKSQHLLGKAVDISTKNMSGAQKFALLKAAFNRGFTGVGVYPTFFHLDVRDIPVFFLCF